MEAFLAMIDKNPYREKCPSLLNDKQKEEIESKEQLWGMKVKQVKPSRLTTAWLMSEDPLMEMAGQAYKSTEVRDKTFELQQECGLLKGNRKLSKVKMLEALSSLSPNEEHTKIVAAILLALKQVQVVCFNEEKKSIWTMPGDLREWSKTKKTIWIDHRCERVLDGNVSLGIWINTRELEKWSIEWPTADGGFEEIKLKLVEKYPNIIVKGEDGKKPKKEDYAKALGRAEAIHNLMK